MNLLNKLFLLPSAKKHRLSVLVGVVLLYGVYVLAIEPTVDAYGVNKELNANASQSRSKKAVLQLQSQLHQIENILKSKEKDESVLRKKILDQVAIKSSKEGVRIVQILESNVVKLKEYTTVYNIFEIQGNFEQLNRFLYNLENEINDAKIVSANFQTRTNRTTKTKELTLTIYFQSILL